MTPGEPISPAASSLVPPGREEIREQLERVLAAPTLQASPRRRALLRFVVVETLEGRADRIKGFTVALEVFNRDASFDAQSDPVVRLEARRLRRDLDSYYVGAGRRDRVRITIPKGAYVPHFEWQDVEAAPAAPDEAAAESGEISAARVTEDPADPAVQAAPVAHGPFRARFSTAFIAASIALVALLVAAGLWLVGRWPNGPAAALGTAIIVLPFESHSANKDDRYLASGVTQEVITDLMRFSGLRIFSVPASFRQDANADPVALGDDLGVAYVVKGGVRSDEDTVRVGAQLFDAETGQVLWSETYDRPLAPAALLDVQGELAASIATALGQTYGVVNNDVTARMSRGSVASMPSYACVLRAYEYRRTFATALYAPAIDCLEAAVQRDPEYPEAWALLGWLYLDAARFGLVAGTEADRAFETALESASHALALDPSSVPALQAVAAIQHYRGDFEESERNQRRALALNPHDPDTLAQLGWRLAVRGRWEEGVAYIERAIQRTVSPPGWYFNFIAIHLYLQGKYPEMLAAAERGLVDGSATSWSLVAIAKAELGEPEAARRALDKMAEIWPPYALDPAAEYRQHKPLESTVQTLVAGLRKAGWSEPDALSAPRAN